MELVSVSEQHLDAMTGLLVELHRAAGGAGPSHALADPVTARQTVAAAIRTGPGVLAVDGTEPVGYMIGPLPSVPGPSRTRLGAAHHAVRPVQARSVYRAMYTAISAQLVAAGCTHHSLPILSEQNEAAQALFELEFGVDQIDGILSITEGLAAATTDGPVRAATPADVDGVVELAIELATFHSRAPMFQPALLDVAAVRRGIEGSIHDERSTVVVVQNGDRLMAMAQAGPSSAYPDALDIGMNVVTEDARSAGVGTAMLDFVLRWAATAGYHYCTVGWTSSNPVSDAFYRSRGFAPVRYRLHRRIDPRIAWANESLDLGLFGGQ